MLPNAINENLPYLKSVLITGNKMLFSDKIEVLSSEELGRTPPPPPQPLTSKRKCPPLPCPQPAPFPGAEKPISTPYRLFLRPTGLATTIFECLP